MRLFRESEATPGDSLLTGQNVRDCVASGTFISCLTLSAVQQGGFFASPASALTILLVAAGLATTRALYKNKSFSAEWRHSLVLGGTLLFWGFLRGEFGFSAMWPWLFVTAAMPFVLLLPAQVGALGKLILARGLASIGVCLALAGWMGVVWHIEPWGFREGGIWRASTFITYPNAAGACMVVILLLASSLSLSDHDPVLRLDSKRAGSRRCLLMLLLLGLLLTLSRGSLISLLIGLLVLIRRVGMRRFLDLWFLSLIGVVLSLASLIPVVSGGSLSSRWIALTGLVIGLLVAAVGHRLTSQLNERHSLIIAITSLAVVFSGVGALRFFVASGSNRSVTDRVFEQKSALAVFLDNPIIGAGAGRANLTWHDDARNRFTAAFAHNEFLQIAAEFGLIGVALVLLMFWKMHVGLAKDGGGGGQAILWAFLAQSLVDFLWHVPVVPLTAAIAMGTTVISWQRADMNRKQLLFTNGQPQTRRP